MKDKKDVRYIMSTIGIVIGMLFGFGAALLMYIFYFIAMSEWLGFLGRILAIILAPGLAIFPFLFWIVEKVFPLLYFIVWGVGIVGMLILSYSKDTLNNS